MSAAEAIVQECAQKEAWKVHCVPLIEGKLYFSTKDFRSDSDISTATKCSTSPTSEAAAKFSKRGNTFAKNSTLFVGLTAKELIDQTWLNTDYYGPLSLTQIFKWKDLFMELNDDPSLCVCFFISAKNPVPHVMHRQHLNEEMLVNAVLLLSICMMLFVFPQEGDDLVVSTIVSLNPHSFLNEMNENLCTFHAIDKTDQVITPNDCLMGLTKAIQSNVLNLDTLDVKKARRIKKKYDICWVMDGKLAASCSPNCKSYFKTGVCPTLDEYVEYYKANQIMGVVRLNDPLYDRQHFIQNGIEHLDVPFMDGGVPSADIVRTFMKFVERINAQGGAVVVHCRGGIGRTGTLIGCYLMKEFGFSANEVVAYLRLVRPGSVSSLQHYYLKSVESDLLKMSNSDDLHLPSPNAEVMRRSNISRILGDLGISIDLNAPGRHCKHIMLSHSELEQVFSECRLNIMGGNKAVTITIPYLLQQLPFMEINTEEQKIKMPVQNFLYLVENIMTCGRMDVLAPMHPDLKDKPVYH